MKTKPDRSDSLDKARGRLEVMNGKGRKGKLQGGHWVTTDEGQRLYIRGPRPTEMGSGRPSLREQADRSRAMKGDRASRLARIESKAKYKAERIGADYRNNVLPLNKQITEKYNAADRARKPEQKAKLKAEADSIYSANRPKVDRMFARKDKLEKIVERAKSESVFARGERRGFSREDVTRRKTEAGLIKMVRSPKTDPGRLDSSMRRFPEVAAAGDRVGASARARMDKRKARQIEANAASRAKDKADMLSRRAQARKDTRNDIRDTLLNGKVKEPGYYRSQVESARDRLKQNRAYRAEQKAKADSGKYDDLIRSAKSKASYSSKAKGPDRLKAASDIKSIRKEANSTTTAASRLAEQRRRAESRRRAKFTLFGGRLS